MFNNIGLNSKVNIYLCLGHFSEDMKNGKGTLTLSNG